MAKKKRITIRKVSIIFLISVLVGYIFELYVSKFWQYDTLFYFLGVPLGIVFVWGLLLTVGYLILNLFEAKTKIPFYFDLLLLYIPVIILVEFIGTNILNWQINEMFPALIGNFMKAPITIYITYYLVTLIVYVKIFRLIGKKPKKRKKRRRKNG